MYLDYSIQLQKYLLLHIFIKILEIWLQFWLGTKICCLLTYILSARFQVEIPQFGSTLLEKFQLVLITDRQCLQYLGYITLSKTRIWAVLRVMKLFDEQFMTRKINFWKKKKEPPQSFLLIWLPSRLLKSFLLHFFKLDGSVIGYKWSI